MISAKAKHRGYIRPLPRYTRAAQEAALSLLCGVIYVEGEGSETLDEAVRSLRRGDVLVVQHMHLLAEPKRTTADKPRASLWSAIEAIETKGASILEADTGRSSLVRGQRDGMIADAIETLTRSGRALSRRKAQANGRKGGRPPIEWTEAQIEQARRAWFDLRHPTNAAALRASPKGWTMARSYRTFGASGRKT